MTVDDMRVCGWLRGMKVLKAAEVKALPIGMKVYLIGPDRHGDRTEEEGVVVQSGKKKVLRMWNRIGHVQIRNYPGKVWAMEEV